MTNTEFLSTLFGKIPATHHLWVTQFAGHPGAETARWNGFALESYSPMFPTQLGCNQYFSVAMLTGMKRQKTCFVFMPVLVLDDAGENDLAPTYVLRTSPDKVQMGFKLRDPIRDVDVAARLVSEAIKHGMIKSDTSGNNAVRYVRLPEGWNAKHSPPFKCVMDEWNPDLGYTLAELVEALGLDLDYILSGGATMGEAGTMHSDEDMNPDSYYIGRILSGESYHDPLLKLSARYVVSGAPDIVVVAMLRAIMDLSVGLRNQRWADRYREIERITREARAKFAYSQAEADTVDVDFGPVSEMEERTARLTPRVIVENLVYADVGAIISGGGTGKTTVELYKMTLMALGRPVFGRNTIGAVRTAFFTKEDSREQLAARMREIKKALGLTPQESAQVRENTRIIQLPGSFRVSAVSGDMVIEHAGHIKWLGDRVAPFGPDRMVFDPMVSFGVGEARVNDAEQGIVEAMRCFRDRFECSAEVIHHSGKQNARDGTLDMYSSRGGSALPDGCRMVNVMQPLNPAEFMKLTGAAISEEEDSGIVIAFPKISHCRPQDSIYLKRTGYAFEQIFPLPESDRERGENMAIENQLWQFLFDQAAQGNKWNGIGIVKIRDQIGLTKNQIEAGLARLKASGSILEVFDEKDRRKNHLSCMTRS